MRRMTYIVILCASLALAAADAQTPASGPMPVTRSTTGTATQPLAMPAGWKLPKFARVDPLGFTVSADGRWAVVPVAVETPRHGTGFRCWLGDLRSREIVDLADVLAEGLAGQGPQAINAVVSNDGKYLAVRSIRIEGRWASLYLMNLVDHSVVRLAQGLMVTPVWMGPKLAITTVDANADIQPIRVYDPARGTMGEIPIRGMIAASDANGTVIVCGCDPNAPSAPVNMKDFSHAAMLTMEPGGKVLRRLGAFEEVATMPLVSPAGQWLAFQYNGWKGEPNGRPDVVRVEVMSVRGQERWSVDEVALPVAVGDDGAAVTIQLRSGPQGSLVQSWRRGQAGRTLVDGAWAASLVGGKVYYVSGGEDKALWVAEGK